MIMRKKSVKATETIAETITETAAKVKDSVNTEEIVKTAKTAKTATKTAKAATKTAAKTVRRAAGTRVKEVSLEIFETSVSMKAVEKAVKKAVADRGLTGDICIYINAERRAAYYTVNQEGSDEYRIDLGNL